ncbi:MAG: DUF4317 domain-containing protein [Oscillospiraceae bacterium]|nr:DUF4317 domain-containing protein [Oscillospiraceae bacterium]
MNKKDIAEIKKNFSDDSTLLSLSSVTQAYIDAERNVHCKERKGYAVLSEEETEVVFEMLKKVMSGTIGKNIFEYAFPKASYEDGGAQNMLYAALNDKDDSSGRVDAVIDRIRENLQYDAAYCILIAHCEYSIMKKNKNDDIEDSSDNIYRFLIAAVSPMNTNTDGLYYNADENRITKKSNTDLIVSRAPTDGFMYPVYSDRAPDVNHVMYYSKNAKKPNISFVEDVLDCEFAMTAESEKETFRKLVENVVGEDLSYTVVTGVNEIIKDVIAQNKDEPEPVRIDNSRLRTILSDAGVNDDKLGGLSAAFETALGDKNGSFTASNLVDSKTVVQTSEITINIGNDAAERVRTGVIQGKKCLIIDLEDPNLKINGFDTTVNSAE